jgi:hypothetical protein
MRIAGHIPHSSIYITVFIMNEKYILKLEAGPMEQVFKFSKDEVKGMDDIKKFLNKEFLDKAIERFNQMFSEMKDSIAKIGIEK